MPDVRWSEAIDDHVARLPIEAQRQLWQAVATLHRFPEME